MTAKLNPEVKKEWLRQLRSGKIQQVRRHLRDGDAMCCLGVLCNVHAAAHPEIAAKQHDKHEYIGHRALPPGEVILWAFNESTLPSVHSEYGQCSLATLNDNFELSFNEIADIIEEQL